jgi:hypothetical protein
MIVGARLLFLSVVEVMVGVFVLVAVAVVVLHSSFVRKLHPQEDAVVVSRLVMVLQRQTLLSPLLCDIIAGKIKMFMSITGL